MGEPKGLHYDIEKEIKSRQLHEVSKAREQIFAIAQKLDVSVEDLLGVIKKTKAGKAEKGKARYKNTGDSPKNVVRAWASAEVDGGRIGGREKAGRLPDLVVIQRAGSWILHPALNLASEFAMSRAGKCYLSTFCSPRQLNVIGLVRDGRR